MKMGGWPLSPPRFLRPCWRPPLSSARSVKWCYYMGAVSRNVALRWCMEWRSFSFPSRKSLACNWCSASNEGVRMGRLYNLHSQVPYTENGARTPARKSPIHVGADIGTGCRLIEEGTYAWCTWLWALDPFKRSTSVPRGRSTPIASKASLCRPAVDRLSGSGANSCLHIRSVDEDVVTVGRLHIGVSTTPNYT